VALDSNRGRNRYGTGSITLGPRDSLEGRLTVEGDLQIFGTVEGELKVLGNVSLEDGSIVRASIQAKSVSIRGNFEGDLAAEGRLLIGGCGDVKGNARISRLAVEDGAIFNGSITMSPPSSPPPSIEPDAGEPAAALEGES
jgi:cytoskeletal protein CcmA (bactofilin family)